MAVAAVVVTGLVRTGRCETQGPSAPTASSTRTTTDRSTALRNPQTLLHAWHLDDREYRRQEERGIDTVLITGTVTNVCCESSARDACTLGYRVIMIADANATGRDCDHNATLRTVYRSFGDVRPTAEVLAMITGQD
ncbi:isochorismatase family protein [Streptomyces sp. C10]|uniref:isochorismatase family protein n=1 Tax=Streptomyces sp. C10 TaxID=531941 RepID=UPI0039810351